MSERDLTIETWLTGEFTTLCDLAGEFGTVNQSALPADAVAPYRDMDYGTHMATVAAVAQTEQPIRREFVRLTDLHGLDAEVTIIDDVGRVSALGVTIDISTTGLVNA